METFVGAAKIDCLRLGKLEHLQDISPERNRMSRKNGAVTPDC